MTSTTPSPLKVTSTDELRTRARRALDRCEVVLPPESTVNLRARTPITGENLFAYPQASADDVTAAAREWLPSAAMHAVVVGEPATAVRGLAAVGLGAPEERLADEVLAH